MRIRNKYYTSDDKSTNSYVGLLALPGLVCHTTTSEESTETVNPTYRIYNQGT